MLTFIIIVLIVVFVIRHFANKPTLTKNQKKDQAAERKWKSKYKVQTNADGYHYYVGTNKAGINYQVWEEEEIVNRFLSRVKLARTIDTSDSKIVKLRSESTLIRTSALNKLGHYSGIQAINLNYFSLSNNLEKISSGYIFDRNKLRNVYIPSCYDTEDDKFEKTPLLPYEFTLDQGEIPNLYIKTFQRHLTDEEFEVEPNNIKSQFSEGKKYFGIQKVTDKKPVPLKVYEKFAIDIILANPQSAFCYNVNVIPDAGVMEISMYNQSLGDWRTRDIERLVFEAAVFLK